MQEEVPDAHWEGEVSDLTRADEKALLILYRSSKDPCKRVHVVSHFRFFRLLLYGMVATIPPRLTRDGLLRAQLMVLVEKSL